MTKEEREVILADKRAKASMATEILYIVTKLTPVTYGKEYPKKIESKVINVTRKQLYDEMLEFDVDGWVTLGYIYNSTEKRKALEYIDEYKKKLRKSPAVKRVL